MKEKPNLKMDLEKIMEKIREMSKEHGCVENMFGYGLLGVVIPIKQYGTIEERNIVENQHREYTDNGLAGNWFHDEKEILEPKSRDYNFVYPDMKTAVNHG